MSRWLGNPIAESIFILSPAVLPVIAVIMFQSYFTTSEVNSIWWLLLVLCIDVSHVYSTLFRLYWDKSTFKKYKRLLIVIPVIGFLVGFSLHLYDSLLFWRILAYIAVYHFIRQQYGFLRLYSRYETYNKLHKLIDTIAIYAATIYPLAYWHFNATNKLAWFVKGDFIKIDEPHILPILTVAYFLIIVSYVIKEIIVSIKNKAFNFPKNLIVTGTFLSWYFGIVAFQADLIFTLLNVVAHGIPYMALIWIHGQKKSATAFKFNLKGISIFILVLIVLAYVEENLWDSLVWKDHAEIFPLLSTESPVNNTTLLSIVVSILVLPQITHYVLDGFIWRFSKDSQARI
jgi:hypothetical protein